MLLLKADTVNFEEITDAGQVRTFLFDPKNIYFETSGESLVQDYAY